MCYKNITKINDKDSKETLYLFDIPSSVEDDAVDSYILSIKKDGHINIKKVNNYDEYFEKIKNSKSLIITPDKNTYKLFLEKLKESLEITSLNNIVDNEEKEEINDNEIKDIAENYELIKKNQK